jgi:hypothetical protein
MDISRHVRIDRRSLGTIYEEDARLPERRLVVRFPFFAGCFYLSFGKGVTSAACGFGLCHLDRDRRGGTGLLGIILFNEPATLARIAFIFVIIVGTIGLKLSSN